MYKKATQPELEIMSHVVNEQFIFEHNKSLSVFAAIIKGL